MKRTLSLIMALALIVMLFAACGNSSSTETAAEESATSAAAAVEASESASEKAPAEAPAEQSASAASNAEAESAAEDVESEPVTITYPIFDDTMEMTIFGSASAQFLGSVDMDTYSQTAAVQKLEEATGIRLDYSSMTNDDVYQEKLTLMIASGDYPDFFCKAATYYATGAEGLIAEEVCINMVDYLDEFAPDLKALLDSDPEYADLVYTDDGSLVEVKMRAAPTTEGGAIIRQDWLDELGLEAPETYDELHEVLLAFKNEYSCSNTIGILATLASPLNYGFNISFDSSKLSFVVDENKVVSSNIEQPAAEEYVALMAQYYSEGLFSSDFLSNTSPMVFDNMVAANETGFWSSGRMSFNGNFESTINDDNAAITALKDITKTGTETSNIGGAGTATGKNAICISTQNEYPEESMSFINYMFTEDGIELANYGVEGDTFEYDADGSPVYTDVILKNADGYNSNVARSLYTLNAFLPYYQTQEALELTFTSERMAEAENIWKSTRSAAPYTWNLNSEEADEYNRLASTITTYMQEQITAFVVGQRDMSEWAAFIEELNDMDLARVNELEQQAFDRKYA